VIKLWRKTWLSDDLLVRAPGHGKRALAVAAALLLVGLAAIAVLNMAPQDAWYRDLASPVLGGMVGWACTGVFKRMNAYKWGWLSGRTAMVRSLREASRRDLSVGEWLEGERQRDAVLLGLDESLEQKEKQA